MRVSAQQPCIKKHLFCVQKNTRAKLLNLNDLRVKAAKMPEGEMAGFFCASGFS
jgi:hypothetical protein